MNNANRRTVRRLTDPKALRALAHPLRLTLIGLLRREGPLTATKAAELLGESSASCSFHLRQLAKYGLAEAAPGGKGRERPWQATAMFTAWPDAAQSPELAAATDLLNATVADSYFDGLMRWLEAKPSQLPQWQHAAHFGDTMLYVTAEELVELAEQEQALVDRYLDRLTNPQLRPADAREVMYLHLAFPSDLPRPRPDGAGAGRPPAEAADGGAGDGGADNGGTGDDGAQR